MVVPLLLLLNSNVYVHIIQTMKLKFDSLDSTYNQHNLLSPILTSIT